MNVTAIVLAGGKNLRLGRSKALETVGGKSIVERVIERLRPLASQILIVTSAEQTDLLSSNGVEILVDLHAGQGPLGGIYTGLLASRSSRSIAVACDMPFLNTRLLGHMVELLDDFDAVVPRLDGGFIEPLHAVYSKSCLEKMKNQLEGEQLSIHSLLKTLRVRYIEQAESRKYDPRLLSFFNINYQADLDKAIALEAEENS
jgi:molybdopterin-guanine dinucleotide biosynthesis protein A